MQHWLLASLGETRQRYWRSELHEAEKRTLSSRLGIPFLKID
jgi:hypothetical protein